MNKSAGLALGAAAIAAGVFGGMAWTGGKIEARMTTQTRADFEKLSPLITVKDLKYDKTLTGATRSLTLQMGCDASPLQLVWRDRIQTGPFPGFSSVGAAVVDSELILSEQTKAKLKEVLGLESAPLTARSTVSFTGDISSDFTMPKLDAKLPDGTLISWSGLTGKTVRQGESIRYETTLPSVEMTAPDKSFSMKMSGLKTRGTTSTGKYWWASIGSSSGELASMELSAKRGGDATKVLMRDMKMTSTSTLQGDLLTGTSQTTGSMEFGKAKIEKLEMKASVDRLHGPTLDAFITTLMSKESLSTLCATADTAGTAEKKAELQQVFSKQVIEAAQEMLVKLLPHNPEYRLDKLAGTYEGKTGELSYSVGTQGLTADEAAKIKSDPKVLIKRLVASASMRFPQPWIRSIMTATVGEAKAPNDEALGVMIEPAVQQGFVVREGEFLVLKATLKDGLAKLNGKDIPIPGQ